MTPIWTRDPALLARVAHFFAAEIGRQDSYISHGEIQGGLSRDGRTWAPNLQTLFTEDLASLEGDQYVAVIIDAAGEILAAAILEIEESPRLRFGVLADVAVSATARSQGLGAVMLRFVEDEARRQGCRWMFLESGKSNTRAHAFFEGHGYGEISHVFGKRLTEE
jgi:GNAT superfamily N-acetyltransferase